MKITRKVKYDPKGAFSSGFVLGLLFNILGFVFASGTTYSNADMEQSKWAGVKLGCLVSTGILVIGASIFGIIELFKFNIIFGVVLLLILVVLSFVLFYFLIKPLLKKAKEKREAEELFNKKRDEMEWIQFDEYNNIGSFINDMMDKKNKLYSDDEKIIERVLEVYRKSEPKKEDIVIKRIEINKKNIIIIHLPKKIRVNGEELVLINPDGVTWSAKPLYKMLGFIDMGERLKYFELRNNGCIECHLKKEDGFYYHETLELNIVNEEEFINYLKKFKE